MKTKEIIEQNRLSAVSSRIRKQLDFAVYVLNKHGSAKSIFYPLKPCYNSENRYKKVLKTVLKSLMATSYYKEHILRVSINNETIRVSMRSKFWDEEIVVEKPNKKVYK